MSYIKDLKQERQEFAKFLADPEYSGIRRIVEDLYPDKAHFIFELLQNAEDVGATEAEFVLSDNSLIFEHNGSTFTDEDLRGITNIGKGSKGDQDGDVIGRFGIGFKAVFAYTETPHIWSPSYSFSISDWIVPNTLPENPNINGKTRFKFPFNNKKKSPQNAYNEILEGLNALSETTLLFLSHLSSVSWKINTGQTGVLLKHDHDDNHIEVLKEFNNETTSSSHFLCFSEIATGCTKHKVSIAYDLVLLQAEKIFDPKRPFSEQLKIVPSEHGRVFVYFPAEKETSGLRFHLHAPFVPDPSRASIKQTPLNDPLFRQLAELTSTSLHRIKEIGLLTVDFLGALPSFHDNLAIDYKQIREAITVAMNEQPLTPTYSRTHAPAKYLLQSRVALKELLSDEDIEFLFDYDEEPPRWAMSASQKNSNADRFLSGLAITRWDVAEFVQTLVDKSQSDCSSDENGYLKWLSAKTVEWHQRLYSLLKKEYSSDRAFYQLCYIEIVRLNNCSYCTGKECFFPSDSNSTCSEFPTVDIGVYTSGKSKTQQEDAYNFLKSVGVQELKLEHFVKAILDQRYTKKTKLIDKKLHIQDLRNFMSFVDLNPERGSLFANYFIFHGGNENWFTPNDLYIDLPFNKTDLSAYYHQLGDDSPRKALSKHYLTCKLSRAKLSKFTKAVGVQHQLSIEETKGGVRSHPLRSSFRGLGSSARITDYFINEDWNLPNLTKILMYPSEVVAKLLWSTMRKADTTVLKARYRPNASYPTHTEDSSLVILLKDNKWVPQGDDEFVKPAQASRDKLPKGFPYDSGDVWLEAVHFGEEEESRSEEHRIKESAAKENGFKDAETFDRARKIMAILPAEEQIKMLLELERKSQMKLPERQSNDAERRANRIAQLALEAPERKSAQRLRAVPVTLTKVKQAAEQYLRDQYTVDSEMICQICGDVLPFKIPGKGYYFETVELLDESGLKQRHYQNYLALCPNHCAMFKYANSSKGRLKEMLAQLTENELEIVLADRSVKIYFTKMHLEDLKTVITSDAR